MLIENLELELNKQFKASQERYVYFLLAVVASAIGFAITQSKIEAANLLKEFKKGLSKTNEK